VSPKTRQPPEGENLAHNHAFGEALRRKATRVDVVFAAVFALGLGVNIWMALENTADWGIDYNQFYAASRLAGTGHLYDWDALQKAEAENGRFAVLTGRLPVVIYGHRILGSLPYAVAQSMWLAGSVGALFFAAFWPGTGRWPMMIALAWSMPAIVGLFYGQDIFFFLMFFTAGLLLMERKRPWSAGVAFALCLCKFHLALGIPVMLVAQKRWRALLAGTTACLALIAGSFLIEGSAWPLQYAKFAQMSAFSRAPERMPNLHGIVSWLPWTTAIETVCTVAIVWLLWAACREGTDLGTAGAAAAACGLLLGYHGYAYDCVLLLPLSVLTIQRPGVPAWVKIWAALLLSPVPVLLLVSQRPLPGQILIVAFAVTAVLYGKAKPFSRPAAAGAADGCAAA
jgi:hypothetical protein